MLKWTKRNPDHPGWYWYKEPGAAIECVELGLLKAWQANSLGESVWLPKEERDLVFYTGEKKGLEVSDAKGRWFGPINPPLYRRKGEE